MLDQPQSQERGVYNRAGWVIITAVLGVLFLLSGVCALTPSGENIITNLRTRMNITSSLNSDAQPSGSLIDTLFAPSTPSSDPTSEPPADAPTAVVEQPPTDQPRPTETKRPPTSTPTRSATKALTAIATKQPTDRPTATVRPDVPTSTPKPAITPNTTAAVTAVVTANATAVVTVVQPDCHCEGVDQVCANGDVSYNNVSCGGSGGCLCRGTTRVCPDGSSTPLHPSCIVNNPVCTCQITTCDFTKVPPLCLGVCLETGAACTP
jgi:hypothetical protein